MYTNLLVLCFQGAVKQVLKDERLNYTYRDDNYQRRTVHEIETRLRILEAYAAYRLECLMCGYAPPRFNRLR